MRDLAEDVLSFVNDLTCLRTDIAAIEKYISYISVWLQPDTNWAARFWSLFKKGIHLSRFTIFLLGISSKNDIGLHQRHFL